MMHLALIGMSGSGKSYWSKRLATHLGCEQISCDEIIERGLGQALGRSGIAGVAEWLGFPNDERYAENSVRYLALEEHSVICALTRMESKSSRIVLDTTGSLIYLPRPLLERLRTAARIIHLETLETARAEMLTQYLADPKPVIWGEIYRPAAGEDPDLARKRLYPELLTSRESQYKSLAHISIPYDARRSEKFSVQNLLRTLGEQ